MPALEMALQIVTVRPGDRAPYAAGIAALERGTSYPLGTDRFELDHGPDYFAFFDRLGEATYEVALDGPRVVAIACRVLRARPFPCWYLCDLKVHPEYRGQRIATRFARHAFARAYGRCGRGYAISMNEPGAAQNRVERLVARLPLVPFTTTPLSLYSLDTDEALELAPLVTRHRGPHAYLSLEGRKDLVLASTGARLPLMHAQFGPCAEAGEPRRAPCPPRAGCVHMLCTPAGDPLDRALSEAGVTPSASAVVLHHRMRRASFDFVLTSDI